MFNEISAEVKFTAIYNETWWAHYSKPSKLLVSYMVGALEEDSSKRGHTFPNIIKNFYA